MAHMSRFRIHDDETAPAGSQPILKVALNGAPQLPNFVGVIAANPSVLRAYTRFRHELRDGALPAPTTARVALAVAAHHKAEPVVALRTRLARQAGIGHDEIARAKRLQSADVREHALLAYVRHLLNESGHVPQHVHEQTREAGWTEEQLLEAIALVAIESFMAMVTVAGDVPADGSAEEARQLLAVA